MKNKNDEEKKKLINNKYKEELSKLPIKSKSYIKQIYKIKIKELNEEIKMFKSDRVDNKFVVIKDVV
jgi:hypothetical protein